MARSAAILLNCSSHSKRAAKQRARIAELFATSRVRAELLCSETGAELASLARRAVRGDYELIVAAGGDGTVNAVASAVAGTSKVLGVLPLGTVNHFARHIGVPLDLPGAVRALADAEPAIIDVGEVNGRVFVNNSTIGVYPRIIRYREHLRTRHGLNKWLAFAYAAARMLPRRGSLRLRVAAEGFGEIKADTPFLFLGRSDSALGALDLVPGQKPDRGKLSVCLVHAGGRLSTLRLASRAAVGRLPGAEGFVTFQTAELLISTEAPRLHVAMDGEIVLLATPLHYRVLSGALRVAAPRKAATSVAARRESAGEGRRPRAGDRGEEAPCVR